jgi:hypothetical protein
MADFVGERNLLRFAKHFLSASPGATVLQKGKLIRIPTLVPRKKMMNGACIFYEHGQCTVHEVSPFGCAFFDDHQDPSVSDYLSRMGLIDLMKVWAKRVGDNGYIPIWIMLDHYNLRAPSPEFLREQMEVPSLHKDLRQQA